MHKLLSHYVEVEEWFDYGDDFSNVDNLELVLGGDHGKGSYSLLASIVVRFKDHRRDPDVLDLECGRIEYHQDKIELLKILIEKLKPSLDRITSGSGFANFIVTSANSTNSNFKFYTNISNVNYFNNMILHLNTTLILHLNCDTKGTMQTLGRNTFDSHY